MYEFYQYLHMWEMVPNRTVYCSSFDSRNWRCPKCPSGGWGKYVMMQPYNKIPSGYCLVSFMWRSRTGNTNLRWHTQITPVIASGLGALTGKRHREPSGNVYLWGVGSGACISQTHQTVPQQSLHSSVRELYFCYNKTQFLKTKIKQKQTNLYIKLVA